MTGLVGWWPLHENSGSIARDLSGKGNHGNLSGEVTQGVGGKGGLTAYSFDGSGDYIDLADLHPYFNSSPPATFSAYVKTSSTSWQVIIGSVASASTRSGTMQINSGNLSYYDSGGGHNSSLVVADGEWHHVVVVDDGTDIHYYVDEQSETAQGESDGWDGEDYWSIGRREAGPGKYFDGEISNVRAYNRALSPQEIQTLYEWGNGDYASPPNKRTDSSSAVSRWKFDGDVKDSWGSNDGTDKTSAGFSSDAIRGQAKKFDGDDDYVNLGDMGSLGSSSSQLTYSIWMSNDDTKRRNLYGFNKDTSSTHNIQINSNTDNNNDPGNLRYIFKDSDGSALRANLSRNVPLNSGNLNHLVFTQDLSANRLNFYFNSSRIPVSYSLTQTPSEEDFPMDLYLGNQNYKGSVNTPISGAIDEFRIYNRVLEPHEVFQLYQWGTRGRDIRKLTVNSR